MDGIDVTNILYSYRRYCNNKYRDTVPIDREQSLFCSRIREEERKEERNINQRLWACERDMQSREPQVQRPR